MKLDSEKFSNIASGIQSITIAIGLIVGGIWAIYKFDALGEVERNNIKKGFTIETDIKTHHTYIESDSSYLLFADVVVSNRGEAPVSIDIFRAPIRAVRIIDIKSGEAPMYGKEEYLGYEYEITINDDGFDSLIIEDDKIHLERGSTKVKNYVFKTREDGLYFIEFRFFRPLPAGLEKNDEGEKVDNVVLTDKRFHLIN